LAETLRTVAILAAQPALNALLGMVLAGAPNLRVRTFESELTLQVYMRIARVDLVVVDSDDIEVEAISLLRADDGVETPGFRAIALSALPSRELKQRCDAADVSEIVMKPMSPRYLLERVQARLKEGTVLRQPRRPAVRQLVPLDFSQFANVIPLWTKDRQRPVH
jgi:two-component system, OmpR family, phosphate regulon response regulator PhoB